MDRGEYNQCTYCGRTIFPGVAACPYCHQYTDGKGPLGLGAEDTPRKFSRTYVIAGWLVLVCTLLPLLYALYVWLTR